MAISILVNYLKVGNKIEVSLEGHVFLDRPIAIYDLEDGEIKDPMLIPAYNSQGQEMVWPKVVDKEVFLANHVFKKMKEVEDPDNKNSNLVKLVEDPEGKGHWFAKNTRFDCLYKDKTTGQIQMIIPRAKELDKVEEKPAIAVPPETKETAKKSSKKETN